MHRSKILFVAPVNWPHLWEQQQKHPLHSHLPFVLGHKHYFLWRALCQHGHSVAVCRYTDAPPHESLLLLLRRLACCAHPLLKRLPLSTWQRQHAIHGPNLVVRNQRIISAAQQFDPDIILISEGVHVLLAETVRTLRFTTRATLVLLNGMSPIAFGDEEMKAAAPYYHLILVNDDTHARQFRELGARNVVNLPTAACDPTYHAPHPLTPAEQAFYACDVCFVGRLTPPNHYAERMTYLEALADVDLAIWSNDESLVRSNPRLRHCYRGKAYGHTMVKALSAAPIGLNLHGTSTLGGGNLRTFELASIGTFQLIDRYHSVWFEEGQELVSFQSPSDLREKAHYYLRHPEERARIAHAGQQRAHTDHTYHQRVQRMFDLIAECS